MRVTFVRTVPEEQAAWQLGEMYETDRSTYGYVPNYTKVLSIRPEIMAAYRAMAKAIRSKMDLRRYELITVAVAARLRCSY
jgi:alkylhydroperoxidase/carboxymuconolactone decarboxylase family protein YurZ